MINQRETLVRDLWMLTIRGIAFLCICVLSYMILLFLLTNIKITGNPIVYRASQGLVQKGGFTYERFKEFDPNTKYDILAFGSSRVNRGINPHVFEQAGYSIYNLGTDDQTPVNTEVLIKQYAKPGHCKLVIIDLFDKVFSHSPLESSADLIQNVRDDKTAFKVACAFDDIRAINLLGIRMMLKNSPPVYSGNTKLYKGYRVKLNDKNEYNGDFYTYKSNTRNLREFEETLKYLRANHIPYLLVSQPLPEYLKKSNHQQMLKDLKPILSEYHDSLNDFTFGSTITSPLDFADESHLNSKGADKYSHYLLDELVNKVIAPGAKN